MNQRDIEKIINDTTAKHISQDQLDALALDIAMKLETNDGVWDSSIRIETNSPTHKNICLSLSTSGHIYSDRPITVNGVVLDDDNYKKDQSLIIGNYDSQKALEEKINELNLLFKPVSVGNPYKVKELFNSICCEFNISSKLYLGCSNIYGLIKPKEDELVKLGKNKLKFNKGEKKLFKKMLYTSRKTDSDKSMHQLVFGIDRSKLFEFLANQGHSDYFRQNHVGVGLTDSESIQVYAVTDERYSGHASCQVPLATIEYAKLPQ